MRSLQVRSMMRIQSHFRKKWQKNRLKIFSPKNCKYPSAYVSLEEFRRGLEMVVKSLDEAFQTEISRLQRDEDKSGGGDVEESS